MMMIMMMVMQVLPEGPSARERGAAVHPGLRERACDGAAGPAVRVR
jgi:hypothetical protein